MGPRAADQRRIGSRMRWRTWSISHCAVVDLDVHAALVVEVAVGVFPGLEPQPQDARACPSAWPGAGARRCTPNVIRGCCGSQAAQCGGADGPCARQRRLHLPAPVPRFAAGWAGCSEGVGVGARDRSQVTPSGALQAYWSRRQPNMLDAGGQRRNSRPWRRRNVVVSWPFPACFRDAGLGGFGGASSTWRPTLAVGARAVGRSAWACPDAQLVGQFRGSRDPGARRCSPVG